MLPRQQHNLLKRALILALGEYNSETISVTLFYTFELKSAFHEMFGKF